LPIKLAINGFGRIGRQFLKASFQNPEFMQKFEVVAVNDLTDAKTLAHLAKYDSVHRTWDASVTASETTLAVNGKEIRILAEKDPAKLPWKSLGVDYVVESTGLFTDRSGASKHLEAGAKKVLISAPAKDPDVTVVPGVNLDWYDPAAHHLVSMGSCTTNSIAPMARVLQDSFGIKRGYMTTVHAYTNDQRILDLPHKDLRRARAAALSTIPTVTGAAKALGIVVPEVAGKLDGLALRVPVACGSITDLKVELDRDVTKEEVNRAFWAAANGPMKGVMRYTEDPLVSQDVVDDPHTCIIDGLLTNVLGGRGNLVNTFAWYDNEWAFSVKMVETLLYMSQNRPPAGKPPMGGRMEGA
jgi:glyceraldehyde 3-phosphate dehydrogenase